MTILKIAAKKYVVDLFRLSKFSARISWIQLWIVVMHSGRGLRVGFSTGHTLHIADSLQTFSLHTINPIVFTMGDQNKGSTIQQNSLDSTDCYCFRT